MKGIIELSYVIVLYDSVKEICDVVNGGKLKMLLLCDCEIEEVLYSFILKVVGVCMFIL